MDIVIIEDIDPIYKNIMGYVSSILSVLLFLPQLIHMIKRKSAKDVSYFFLILNQVVIFSWFSYGILDNSLPITICNCCITVLNVSMIICKCIYDKNTIESNV